MDNTHHHTEAPAPKNPRRRSFTCSTQTCAVQHYPQNTMKQSQILTPPLTPPRSPRPSISAPTQTPTPPRTTIKDRIPLQVHFDLHTSNHRNTSPTTTASMSTSSLWTLPGSSTLDSETPSSTENRWFRLLQSAASSNRARHRARLEGDGWAFIGGRYSDELQELSDESAGSVDEEFDVVVLGAESVGC